MLIAEERPYFDYKLSASGRFCVGLVRRAGWMHHCWYKNLRDAEACVDYMNAQLQYYKSLPALKTSNADAHC